MNQDNGTKLEFFQYFIECDDYLDIVVQNALKYYSIRVEPKPIILFAVRCKTISNLKIIIKQIVEIFNEIHKTE